MDVTTQATAFDYATLGELSGVVKGLAERIKLRLRKAAEDVIEIGTCLTESKSLLKDRFASFVADELGMSDDSARRFMAVASRFGGNRNVEGWAASALYLLASPSVPEDVANAVLEAGPIPVADVANAIERYADDQGDESDEPQVAEDVADDRDDDPPPQVAEPSAPKPKHAPVFDEAMTAIDKGIRLFEKAAQVCHESASAVTTLKIGLKEVDYYVRQVEDD